MCVPPPTINIRQGICMYRQWSLRYYGELKWPLAFVPPYNVTNYILEIFKIFISIVLVVIDSGPRYEVAYPSGICHFLEKLSFGVSIKLHLYIVQVLI